MKIVLSALSLALVLTVLPLQAVSAHGEANTTVVGLTNASKQMDGQKVIVDGEVVGDIINAEAGHKWLTLSDGGDSISILVAQRDADKITHLGRYGQVGTRIEVSGVFQVDCESHDGLSDVHADKVTVLDEGRKLPSILNIREILVGILLVIVGACLVILHWRLRERTR